MKLLKSYNKLKGKRNLFLGFYGGGNYGDELLMEVLMNYNEEKNINGSFLFLNRVSYKKFHKKFKYSKIVYLKTFFIESLKAENIIFGGGGIFSEDLSIKHLVGLLYLSFISFLLRKKIFFYGLGFYDKTPFIKIIRFLVKNFSEKIYVRDQSSLKALGKGQNIILDNDLSFLLKNNNFEKLYKNDFVKINGIKDFKKEKNLILFSFRPNNMDFLSKFESNFIKVIKNNPDIKFIFWKMMPDYFYNSLDFLKLGNVYILENTNPLSIFYFLKRNKNAFKIITPQFHGIITAKLLDIPFMPIYYSDKGKDIIESFGIKGIKISNITYDDINNFIKK